MALEDKVEELTTAIMMLTRGLDALRQVWCSESSARPDAPKPAPASSTAAQARLLTLSEIAEQTQTSVAFWRKAVARRELPVVRVGRSVRLRERDLEGFLSVRTQRVR